MIDKPSDLIYAALPSHWASRAELEQFICDSVEAVLGVANNEVTNGHTIDTLLRLCDIVMTDPKHIKKLKKFIKDETQ